MALEIWPKIGLSGFIRAIASYFYIIVNFKLIKLSRFL